MVQYIPMFILMAMFGAIGVYWAIGTCHFISWSRKFKATFPRFSDQDTVLSGQNDAAGVKSSSSAMLRWGIRLVGIALALSAAGAVINMVIVG